MSVRKIMSKIVDTPIYIMAFFIVIFFMAMDHVAWYAEEYSIFGVGGIGVLGLLSMNNFGVLYEIAGPTTSILILMLMGFILLSEYYTFHIPTYSESEKTE
jgi:hypothetical protein